MTIGPLEVVFHGIMAVPTKIPLSSIKLEECCCHSDLNTTSVSQTNRGDAALAMKSYLVYQELGVGGARAMHPPAHNQAHWVNITTWKAFTFFPRYS